MKLGVILKGIGAIALVCYIAWRITLMVQCEARGGDWVRPVLKMDYCIENRGK